MKMSYAVKTDTQFNPANVVNIQAHYQIIDVTKSAGLEILLTVKSSTESNVICCTAHELIAFDGTLSGFDKKDAALVRYLNGQKTPTVEGAKAFMREQQSKTLDPLYQYLIYEVGA